MFARAVPVLRRMNTHPPILFLWDTFYYTLFSHLQLGLLPKLCIYFPSPLCMPHELSISSTSVWYPNSQRYKIMKLLTMYSFPASCNFFSVRYKYSPQHSVREYTQSVFFCFFLSFHTPIIHLKMSKIKPYKKGDKIL